MATTAKITAEQLWEMGEDCRCELIEGELIEMSSAGREHGAIDGRLAAFVGIHVLDQELGESYTSDTGFRIGPDTVLAPDVAFVRTERLPTDDDPRRFLPADHPRWPHHWRAEPVRWRTPEDELLAVETGKILRDAIDTLPAGQREVLVLRDLEGRTGAEVCNILGLTDTHQRVLLHRARSRVRHALERYFTAAETT